MIARCLRRRCVAERRGARQFTLLPRSRDLQPRSGMSEAMPPPATNIARASLLRAVWAAWATGVDAGHSLDQWPCSLQFSQRYAGKLEAKCPLAAWHRYPWPFTLQHEHLVFECLGTGTGAGALAGAGCGRGCCGDGVGGGAVAGFGVGRAWAAARAAASARAVACVAADAAALAVTTAADTMPEVIPDRRRCVISSPRSGNGSGSQ